MMTDDAHGDNQRLIKTYQAKYFTKGGGSIRSRRITTSGGLLTQPHSHINFWNVLYF